MRLKTSALTLASVLLGTLSAMAQTATVKGNIKDQAGPVVGAQVLLKDPETGRKYPLKTDKKGQFFSIGIAPGKYDVTVTKDGKQVYTANGFPVTLNQEVNQLDIDLTQGAGGEQAAQVPAQAGQQQQQPQQQPKLTEEQKKQIEEINKKNAEVVKENAKIGGLNNMMKEAQTDMQAKNFDAAVTVMQQAEQVDNGQHFLVTGMLGTALVSDKKYPEGADALNKAIQLAQNDPKASDPKTKTVLAGFYDNLGQAYAKTNKIPEAIDAYTKEAELDPTHAAQAYYNEGAVLTNTGKIDEANAAFTKAIQADPTKADAYYQRAINSLQKATVDKSGKMVAPPGTADDFNKYLELEPNGPNADAAKTMLDTLGEKVSTGFKKSK